MSYFDIVLKGGFVMIVLAILSILALTIIIEKFLSLKKVEKEKEDFLNEFNKTMNRQDYDRAKHLCNVVNNVPIANVLSRGFEALQVGSDKNLKETIHFASAKEIHILERGLGTLSTIAATGPLFGFMGTVLGMIKVFMKIQQTGGGVDISVLAGGIWEALITTVAGLIVGIITLSFYNLFIDKMDSQAVDLEDTAQRLALLLRGSKIDGS